MSTHRKLEYTILVLGIAGLLFSGYLSATKLFSGTCAFNESCPYFFGFPACYIGFFIFLLVTVVGGLHVSKIMNGALANRIVLLLASVGTLYAGYFTLGEIPALFSGQVSQFVFGIPTCAWGFLVYVALVVVSLRLQKDFAQ